MAPYTYCEENINIFDTVSAGSLSTGTDYIGFISLGYLISKGDMIGLNIAFNAANPPSSYITYTGVSGTVGQETYVWSSYITPTIPNVVYAFSGVEGSAATGAYEAWRWLWEVTPSTIPASGPLLATGVWIAYMKALNTTTNDVAVTLGTGKSDFVADNNYIELDRDSMAGGQVINSALAPYTPLPGQTQTIPNGQVNFADIIYFVSAYINYFTNNIYNPYADINAAGTINFGSLISFVNIYIAYYTSYNPT
jgi:hypothetical protein